MKQGLKIAFAAFAASAALIKAAPALAEQGAAPEVAVSYVRTADLDLSTDAGQRALDIRLAAAAREVCGVAFDVDLEGQNDVRHCRHEVLARANAQRDRLVARAGQVGVIALSAAR